MKLNKDLVYRQCSFHPGIMVPFMKLWETQRVHGNRDTIKWGFSIDPPYRFTFLAMSDSFNCFISLYPVFT